KRTVVVLADLRTIRILDGDREIARHGRSFDRGLQIEDAQHIDALAREKRHARKGRAADVLSRAAPSSSKLLLRLSQRHQALSRHAAELTRLLRTYGAARLEAAIVEALESDAPHPQAVRHVLEREQEAQGKAAALPLPLRPDPRLENLDFTGHSLSDYDSCVSGNDSVDDHEHKEEG